MFDRKDLSFQLHDLLFFILIVFSFYFTRNILCSLMMILFFGYTFLRMIKENHKMIIPRQCIGLLIFILYGAGNIILSNVLYQNVAQKMIISISLNWLMILAIIQYIYMKKDVFKILKIFETSILIIDLFVIIFSLGTITEGRLASGTNINSNMLSMLCVYGIILTFFFHKKGEMTDKAYWFRLILYSISILLSGSRKGLIMTVIAFFIINIEGKKKKIIKTLLASLGIAMIVYILIMYIPVLYNIIGVRVENLIILLTEGSTDEGSLKSRQTLVQIAMEYIKQKPWTGYGYDCFKMVSGTGGSGKVGVGEVGYYSHNNYIELLFGGGIIGLILYYLPMLYLVINLIKAQRKDDCIVYILAIMISKLAIEYAYVSYYSRLDAYILAVIIGCYFVIREKKNIVE